MKYIFVIFISLMLFGCGDPETHEATNRFVLPEELKDCKVYSLTHNQMNWITVMRCPNSVTSTTYVEGKTTKSSIVVDGVEYERKQ